VTRNDAARISVALIILAAAAVFYLWSRTPAPIECIQCVLA